MLRTGVGQRIVSALVKEGKHMTRLSYAKKVTPIWTAMGMLQRAANAHDLEPELVELVKIRASQVNGCAFCLSMHVRDTLKAGERLDRIATLDAWQECTWYTERERAALAFTEALCRLEQRMMSDALYEATRAVFSEEEIVSLTLAIIAINGWNRLNVAFGTHPEAFSLDA